MDVAPALCAVTGTTGLEGVRLMPPSDSSPPPPRPLTSLPAPTATARPVPVAQDQRSTPGGLDVAALAVTLGWLIVGFVLFNVYVFTGRDLSCTAHRGDAYRSCIRQEDLNELVAEGVAFGLSVVGLIVVFRTLRRHDAPAGLRALWVGVAAAVLAAVCVGVWIEGSQGGWAPSRPFPYDPIPTVWGHATMTGAVLIGCLLGAIVPLSRRHRAE